MLTYDEITKNEAIQTYIIRADESLGALGYTDHSFAHVMHVAETAGYILNTMGYDARTVELAKIAGYMHDIGNALNRNHHAEYGGLLYHVKRMLMTGLAVCDIYPILNRDLVAAGVILHDIEKLNEIESNEYGVSPGYSFEGQMLGHIVQGIKLLDRLTEEMGFPREKALMLEHMILSHHYEPEFGSPKKPLFPEAEVLHYLDILDARMFDMEDALNGVEPGSFSDRIWTLDNRRIYKATDAFDAEL